MVTANLLHAPVPWLPKHSIRLGATRPIVADLVVSGSVYACRMCQWFSVLQKNTSTGYNSTAMLNFQYADLPLCGSSLAVEGVDIDTFDARLGVLVTIPASLYY
jgi:hypothetical protein